MTVVLHGLHPNDVAAAFAVLKEEIASIADRSCGRLTVAGLRDALASPNADGGYRMVGWIAVDSADNSLLAIAIGGVETFDGGKHFKIYGIAGRDRKRWIHLREQIEEWARAQGCTHSVFLARKGYARDLPDYRLEHIELVKDLRP